jgi:surface polysaccharide O-acyltransferase-like enzyme
VAWSIIYLVMREIIDPNTNLIRTVLGASIVPVMYHLWFLYALIGLYLCLPLVGPVIQAASPIQLRYGLGLWVLASGIIPVLEAISGVQSSIELSTMAGYMGYMVLGYVLAKAPTPSRKHAFVAFMMISVGYGITVLGTALITAQQGRFFGWFYGYLSPNVMLFSAGAFVIIRVAFEGRQSRLIRRLSDLSFGIYLCHVLVLAMANKVFDIRGWWIIPFAVLVFAVSAIGAFVLRRIGLAKVLAP